MKNESYIKMPANQVREMAADKITSLEAMRHAERAAAEQRVLDEINGWRRLFLRPTLASLEGVELSSEDYLALDRWQFSYGKQLGVCRQILSLAEASADGWVYCSRSDLQALGGQS